MNHFSAKQLAQYRASAQGRQIKREQRQRQRQQRGWEVARQVAKVLKQEFGVTRVRLFGSLLDWRRVRAESDVDLAVEGLTHQRYLEAVARSLDLSDFSVDLVQVEYAGPGIREVIEQQGEEL